MKTKRLLSMILLLAICSLGRSLDVNAQIATEEQPFYLDSPCVPPPPITNISGPSTVRINSFGTYTASPASIQGNYEWKVIPEGQGTKIGSTSRNTVIIEFGNTPGRYSVLCRSTNDCYSGGMFYSIPVDVTITGYYSVSVGEFKQLTITLLNSTPEKLQVTETYTLYNQTTGIVMSTGRLPAVGGQLNFSSVPTGLYILRIGTGENAEVHKIALK